MRRFYARLLGLYPRRHREQFGEQMMHTLDDSYRDAADSDGRVPIGFWVGVLWDMAESLVRERASTFVIAALILWGVAIVFVPPALPASTWPVMLLPVAVSCAFLVPAPKIEGTAGKASTVLVALAVIGFEIAAGRRIDDVADLVLPALGIVCALFTVKAIAGWFTTGAPLKLWSRLEIVFGFALGVAGAAVLVAGASSRVDSDAMVNGAMYGLIPFACGGAGIVIGRFQRDLLTALAASTSTFIAGVLIWIAARPAIAMVAVTSSRSGWRHAIAGVLLINGIFSAAGAVLGQLVREEKLRQKSGAVE